MPYRVLITHSTFCSRTAKMWLCLTVLVIFSAPYLPLAKAAPNLGEPNDYRTAILQAQRELGAHHYAVVEPSVGLGLNLQRDNQHLDAVDVLQRALHVNRINKGLHHLDHIPIVDLIVHSYLQLGDWQNAEQQQRLRFWIHQRELETATPAITEQTVNQFVDASLHYARWQGKSHHVETDKFPFHQLREAQDALLKARSLMLEHGRGDDPRYLRLLNNAAINHYDIVVYLVNNEVDPTTGSYIIDQDMTDYLLRQNIIMENYRNGTEALEKVTRLTASNSATTEHAMAALNYANWQLLFDRPQTASKEYAKAFDAFVQAGWTREAVNKRLGDPERISVFALDLDILANPSVKLQTEQYPALDDEQPFVVVVFDVTQSGQVRNIAIEKSWPEDDRAIRREARDRVAFSVFRPALRDGKPVAKRDMKIRYLFAQNDFKEKI